MHSFGVEFTDQLTRHQKEQQVQDAQQDEKSQHVRRRSGLACPPQ